jgi:stage III sporulation protein AD
MNIFTYCAAALFCVCGISILKSAKSEITPYASAGAGIILLGYAISELKVMRELIDHLNAYGGGNVFAPLAKALIIAMLCQITAEICRDFGETSIASKVELGGKVAIIYLSIPLIKEVLKSADQML